MKTVIQRVENASVAIDGKVHGRIDRGYMILVGIQNEDVPETVKKMAEKIANLRIFEDENGKMNRNLSQVQGAILSISQFTLYADCRRGNRPSFDTAGEPVHAKEMYLLFNKEMREKGFQVEEGIFGADMKVELLNDGPVTIILDSDHDLHR
ncbi:MAG: D-aminoacyl-tRNA deacylase [Solobacterium sp.]|jgi:D-tyrosyl-tRNA(Tyr) deacylase|nr:D-aminoacyl-tRNA deacylase [Solobacterium sp.]MCH4282067.1 D-aminoacyl-tRNA deacylase [Solobacterium sp.]